MHLMGASAFHLKMIGRTREDVDLKFRLIAGGLLVIRRIKRKNDPFFNMSTSSRKRPRTYNSALRKHWKIGHLKICS